MEMGLKKLRTVMSVGRSSLQEENYIVSMLER